MTTLRRPLALRLYIGTLTFVVCSMLTVALVAAVIGKSPVAVLLLFWLAYVIALSYSECRVSVQIRETGLLVRNRVRKYVIARHDVEGFRIGPTGWDPFRESVHVLTRDGQSVELAVTRRADFVHGRRIRLEQLLDDLMTWKTQP